MVLQPQTQQQQIVAANKLTTAAANSLLQLQQQQQHILLNGNSVVSLCNSIQNQNYVNGAANCMTNGVKPSGGDNNESGSQSNHNIAGQFKIYSE
jgi:hypothetical protein